MAIEAAEGLQFLHFSRVLHLDVKGLNLLVTAEFHVKVADFGLSRHLQTTTSVRPRGFTLTYVAPEVLENAPATYRYAAPDFVVSLSSNRQTSVWCGAVSVVRTCIHLQL